jgi:hypothetical protein
MAEEPSAKQGKRPRLGLWLGTAATVVGLATGILTLRDQIFGGDDAEPPSTTGEQRVPYFDGVASHLERSRDFIGFLQTHDGDAVRLQVGFQIGLDDYSVDGFGSASSEPSRQPWIVLLTECTPPLSPEERERLDLGFRSEIQPGRCMGVDLFVTGRDTDDSGVYVTHGRPRVEGWFTVDFGDLHQGMTGITLKPISPEQASART